MLLRYLLSIFAIIGFSLNLEIQAGEALEQLSSWLVPTPKKANIGQAVELKPLFDISGAEANAAYVKLLDSELRRRYGWQKGRGTSIQFTTLDSEHGREAYELTIGNKSINISIAGDAAGFRAVGRLLAIFDSGLTETRNDRSLLCRELTLKDYPDMPQRGMHLQMAFDTGDFTSVRQEKIRRALDLMLKLGFNFAVFDIGGFSNRKC